MLLVLSSIVCFDLREEQRRRRLTKKNFEGEGEGEALLPPVRSIVLFLISLSLSLFFDERTALMHALAGFLIVAVWIFVAFFHFI